MTTITALNIPANGYQLFYNGYMSPYSNAGHDWMDGAVHVMDEKDVTEELQELVCEYMFHYKQHNKQYPEIVIDSNYAIYTMKELNKYAKKLLSLGYTINVMKMCAWCKDDFTPVKDDDVICPDCLVHALGDNKS